MTKKKASLTSRIITALLMYPLKAYLVMICLGELHQKYTEVPPIGFWSAMLVIIIAAELFSWKQIEEDK